MSHTLAPSAEPLVANVHSVAPAAVHPSESTDDAVGARLAALLAAHARPKAYFAGDVAALFGKSDQWVHWVPSNVPHPDGSPIEPERIDKRRRKRFTRPLIESIVVALCYRGTLTHNGACRVIAGLESTDGLVA